MADDENNTDDCPKHDYLAVSPPPDVSPENLHYVPRRAEILDRILQVGSPSGLDRAQLADHYQKNRSTIKRDVDALVEYLGDYLNENDDEIIAETFALRRRVLSDLLHDVLDPFWGTGTTSLAAMVAARNSISYEIEEHFTEVFDERVDSIPRFSRNVVRKRLDDHRDFVEEKYEAGETFKYEAKNYDFPVKSESEKQLQFYSVENVEKTADGYRAVHKPVEGEGPDLTAENKAGRDTTFDDF